ncbi:MAG: MFS transporter [Legionellaceae bacterium]|nr:MFS transporter [Legionellaceae bacterium]
MQIKPSLSLNYRSLIASVCGNFIEWYDFALYLLLAPILATHFFPQNAENWGLIGTFTVYAVSFFFRPVGGLIFGYIGDIYGRRVALRYSLSCLAGLSVVLAILPSYSQAGVYAPILLCLCRIGQGICLGGEFAGSMIYLSESAQAHRRSFFSALSNNGSNAGILVASISATVLSHTMSEANFADWGYRILFFGGGMVGLIGFAFRSDLQESQAFLKCSQKISNPLLTIIKYHKRAFLRLFAMVSIAAISSYGLMGYASSFLQQSLSVPLRTALHYETLFILLTLVLVPICATFADRFTPQRLLKYTCMLYLCAALPCFYLVYAFQQPLFLIPLFMIYSIEEACTPALLGNYFPVALRYTGVSLAYNICMGLIGGISPMLVQFLLVQCHLPYSIAYLLMGGSLLTLWGLKIPELSYEGEEVLHPSLLET